MVDVKVTKFTATPPKKKGGFFTGLGKGLKATGKGIKTAHAFAYKQTHKHKKERLTNEQLQEKITRKELLLRLKKQKPSINKVYTRAGAIAKQHQSRIALKEQHKTNLLQQRLARSTIREQLPKKNRAYGGGSIGIPKGGGPLSDRNFQKKIVSDYKHKSAHGPLSDRNFNKKVKEMKNGEL